jgi:type I restriction enzyme, R subunit
LRAGSPETQKEFFREFFGTETEGKTEEQIKEDEEKRVSLYKMVSFTGTSLCRYRQ